MAHRPILQKRVKRLRKAIERQTPPVFIDLIDWLKVRGYADTTGQAEKLILAGRVRSESHKLGIVKLNVMEGTKVVEKDFVQPRVPASLRRTIYVAKAKS